MIFPLLIDGAIGISEIDRNSKANDEFGEGGVKNNEEVSIPYLWWAYGLYKMYKKASVAFIIKCRVDRIFGIFNIVSGDIFQ